MAKIKDGCPCGHDKLIIITEKLYEGQVVDGELSCEQDSEAIMAIKCPKCNTTYSEHDFNKIIH